MKPEITDERAMEELEKRYEKAEKFLEEEDKIERLLQESKEVKHNIVKHQGKKGFVGTELNLKQCGNKSNYTAGSNVMIRNSSTNKCV